MFNKREINFDITEHTVYQDNQYTKITYVTDNLILLNSDVHEKTMILKYDKMNPKVVIPFAEVEETPRFFL